MNAGGSSFIEAGATNVANTHGRAHTERGRRFLRD
jgi:hypothetical protein